MDSIEKHAEHRAEIVKQLNEGNELAVSELPAGLDEDQILVLQLLFKRWKFSRAAMAVRVNRSTLYRWRHEDAAFRKAYAMVRQHLRDEVIADAQSLGEDALVNVQIALSQGDNPRLGLAVLKSLGLLKPAVVGEPEEA